MFLVHKNVFKQWFDVLKDGYKIAVSMIEENFHNDFNDIIEVL